MLFAASLAWKAAFVWSGPADQVVLSPWLHSLPAYLDQFALGMALALAWPGDRLPGAVRRSAWPWPRSRSGLVSVQLGIGYALFEPYTRWQFLGRHLLYAAVGAGLVAAAVSATPGPRRGRPRAGQPAGRSSSARSPTASTCGT